MRLSARSISLASTFKSKTQLSQLKTFPKLINGSTTQQHFYFLVHPIILQYSRKHFSFGNTPTGRSKFWKGVADPVNSCWNIEGQAHGLINYKDSKARCRYLKKFTCKGALWQVFYLSEAPFPPMTPCSPSPLHTVYVYTIYLFTQGGGGGGRELTREKVRGATIYKLVEIPTSYEHLPLYRSFF